MSELADGRIAYRLRYPIGGATHRILEPLELMARLAALIAPPRRSLVRYFGVLVFAFELAQAGRSAFAGQGDEEASGRRRATPAVLERTVHLGAITSC